MLWEQEFQSGAPQVDSETCQGETSQITEERWPFPCDSGPEEEAFWHTSVAFVVKVDKTGSPGAALVQQKGRDQWLEKIEE